MHAYSAIEKLLYYFVVYLSCSEMSTLTFSLEEIQLFHSHGLVEKELREVDRLFARVHKHQHLETLAQIGNTDVIGDEVLHVGSPHLLLELLLKHDYLGVLLHEP